MESYVNVGEQLRPSTGMMWDCDDLGGRGTKGVWNLICSCW